MRLAPRYRGCEAAKNRVMARLYHFPGVGCAEMLQPGAFAQRCRGLTRATSRYRGLLRLSASFRDLTSLAMKYRGLARLAARYDGLVR